MRHVHKILLIYEALNFYNVLRIQLVMNLLCMSHDLDDGFMVIYNLKIAINFHSSANPILDKSKMFSVAVNKNCFALRKQIMEKIHHSI